MLFSTHRMDEVTMLADDLGILHEGTLLYDGTYDDFAASMEADTFEDEFIRRIERADETVAATDGRVESVA
ncbi:MAG: hypothetical protein ABEK84_05990 [Salinibacter sp.]